MFRPATCVLVCSVALQCTAAPQGAAQRSAGHRIAPRGAVWCAAAQCSAGHCCQACSAVQCCAVQCCAPWGVGLLPRVQHGAAERFAPWGAAQDSAPLPGVQCLPPQGAAWHGAGQGSAPRGAGHHSWGAAQGSAALLECSSGQCIPPGVQCSVLQRGAVHRSPGCSSGQSIAPGVQHTVGHRVAPRGAAWGCFAGATLHPRCVFGSRGAATPWCHGSPRGAAPHIAAAAGSSGRRVPRGQIFSLQVVITGGVGGGGCG